MEVKDLVKKYLPTVNIMQLATSKNDQPWVCTLHYYHDDELNFYWISTPERRHSQDIKTNPKVSITVLVHENTPDEPYVIGISLEGIAEHIGTDMEDGVVEAFQNKHDKDSEFMRDVKNGTNPHQFYKFTPKNIVMFNNKDFPDNPRQEWSLNK